MQVSNLKAKLTTLDSMAVIVFYLAKKKGLTYYILPLCIKFALLV